MSASLFLDVVIVWELVAIALTLLISGYLITELLAAVIRPRPSPEIPVETTFPRVSVVIPAYNEPREIILGTLAAWKRVRYPEFEVIVADDSTIPLVLDDPSVRVVHRSNREGFKGGALRNVFDQLDPASEWMFVFDADYLVDPDVLVRFAAHFQPGVGGIQGFMAMGRNARPSILTRFSEALHLVAGTILTGRYRHHGFVGVQGTVQAYRVEAIRALGGLAPCVTANEDLDTTFRLRKGGWKIVYDPAIVGRGLAPEHYLAFFIQISRWTATTVREYRRHWRSFLASPVVPRREKVDSFLFLLTWVNSLVVTPTLAFLPWALLRLSIIPIWLAIFVTLLPFLVFMLPTLARRSVKVSVVGWLWYYVLLLPGYFVMFRAALMGLFIEPGFLRTPKEARSAETETTEVDATSAVRPSSSTPRARPLNRLLCQHCGRRLSHAEVLFYAAAALDVDDLSCRTCLGTVEWARFTA